MAKLKQTVLITGGSQGMGKAVASLLAKKGANVIIVARTLKTLQEATKEIAVRSLKGMIANYETHNSSCRPSHSIHQAKDSITSARTSFRQMNASG